MQIPICYDLVCRISYKGHSCAQRINLAHWDLIQSRMPSARIDVLAYKANAVYGWTTITDVTRSDDMACGYHPSSVHGLGMILPTSSEFSWACLPDDFKFPSIEEPQDYILGLMSLRGGDISIESPFKYKKKGISLDAYIAGKKLLNRFSMQWVMPNRHFPFKFYMNYFDDIHQDYIRGFYNNIIDVYLTHLMMKSGHLVPLALGRQRLEEIDLIPFETAWIYQLLYGRSNDIFFKLRTGEEVSFKKLEIKSRAKTVRIPSVNVELKGTSSPVLIYENFAVRLRWV